MTTPPKWQAHEVAGYDTEMAAKCATLLVDIQADQARRLAILDDPRDLHRELFGSFAPAAYPEYAGTYRGAVGTSLQGRVSGSDSQFPDGKAYTFVPPLEVDGRITRLMSALRDFLSGSAPGQYSNLLALAYGFCWFGKIHPFLDGNGHVQRAIFAAMATELGYPLSPRFAIHPRPYDRLLAIALETFTTAPPETADGEVGLVAEYLAFFLDGPFDAVRAHLPMASPY
nr:Fic family protein [Brevundimonas diminuta]